MIGFQSGLTGQLGTETRDSHGELATTTVYPVRADKILSPTRSNDRIAIGLLHVARSTTPPPTPVVEQITRTMPHVLTGKN